METFRGERMSCLDTWRKTRSGLVIDQLTDTLFTSSQKRSTRVLRPLARARPSPTTHRPTHLQPLHLPLLSLVGGGGDAGEGLINNDSLLWTCFFCFFQIDKYFIGACKKRKKERKFERPAGHLTAVRPPVSSTRSPGGVKTRCQPNHSFH